MQAAFRLITSLNLVAELGVPIGASIVVMIVRQMLTFWVEAEPRLGSRICWETVLAGSFMAVGESHVEFKKEPT